MTENFWSIAFFQKLTLAMPTAAIALVLGCLTYRIAREQKDIQKEKVISDLFDRRISVYSTLEEALHTILKSDDIEDLEIISHDVQGSVKYARFLFDDAGYTSINSIILDITKYQILSKMQLKLYRADHDASDLFKQNGIQIQQITDRARHLLSGGLANVFEPYLLVVDFRNKNRKKERALLKFKKYDGIYMWHKCLVVLSTAYCIVGVIVGFCNGWVGPTQPFLKGVTAFGGVVSALLWLQAARDSKYVFPNSLAAAMSGFAILIGITAANDIYPLLSKASLFLSLIVSVSCSVSVCSTRLRRYLIPT